MSDMDTGSGVATPPAADGDSLPVAGLFRAFAENSPNAVFVCDSSERLIWFNSGMERMTGCSAAELMSTRITDLLDPESGRRVAAAIRWRLTSVDRMRHEIQVSTRGGARLDLELFSWVTACNGQPAWIQVIARDVTDTKRREEQARRAERAQLLSFLAGGAAHDFNNLLMAIYAYADQLKDSIDEAELREAADIIQQTAERGIEIASRLLRSATDAKPKFAEMDLHATIQDLAGLLRQTLGAGIRVRTELDAHAARILGDSSQIYQVFLNLALNSRDAMPSGGTIVFRTGNLREPAGEMIYVEVSDEGTGIPPDLLDRIFEPFFTTKEPDKGTGMGLALVNGIVKNHHGRISVRSEAGAGATFRVSLPLTHCLVADKY